MKNKKVFIFVILFVFGFATLSAKSLFKKNSGKKVISVYSYTDEIPSALQDFLSAHPDFDWTIESTIIPTYDGDYCPILSDLLVSDLKNAPDIFITESDDTLKFTKGNLQNYLMPFEELGIDVENEVIEKEISKYTVDIGRNSDGKISGLCYQSSNGVFIYRRSIAKEVLGSDSPAFVAKLIGGQTGNWDKFNNVAAKMANYGYAMLSSYEDLWRPVENSSEKGWVVDGKLYIDPKREAFLEMARTYTEENYTLRVSQWTDDWFLAMRGGMDCFGFFGPEWFVNYVIAPSCSADYYSDANTFGDWAVCASPIGYYWGGSWVHVVNKSDYSEEKMAAIKQLVEYLCLDDTEDGFQYYWATTTDSVPIGTVMKNVSHTEDVLKGQNMHKVFYETLQDATGENATEYDVEINSIWLEYVKQYSMRLCTYEEAIKGFKRDVYNRFGLK